MNAVGASGVLKALNVSSALCVLDVLNALAAMDVLSVLVVLNALENEIAKSKIRRKPMQIIGPPREYKHISNPKSRLRCPGVGLELPRSGAPKMSVNDIRRPDRRTPQGPKSKPAAGRIKTKILNGPLDTENVKAK